MSKDVGVVQSCKTKLLLNKRVFIISVILFNIISVVIIISLIIL